MTALKFTILQILLLFFSTITKAQTAVATSDQKSIPKFHVLVLAERGGDHEAFVAAALDWLNVFAPKNNFDFTVVNHASEMNEEMLSKYQEIIQLNYAPYAWGDTAMTAFVKYIEEGRGGWVGFHHASSLSRAPI